MPLPNNLGQLTGEDYNLLQSRLDKFEAAWKFTDSVDLAAYLPAPTNPLRTISLRELIKSDLEARWRRNEEVLLDFYLEKFPELGDANSVDLTLVVEEYHIRQRLGDRPELSSYERRFPKRYEQLKRLLQVTPGTAEGLDQTLPAQPSDVTKPPASPAHVWMLGEMANTYKLINRLGSGAFAEVWLAEAPGGVRVAVKRLLHVMEKDVAQRELDALERTKNLNHPFLLATHAFWLADDRLHIAMQLADGTLRDRFRECQKKELKGIPRDELIHYFREAADGVDYLHKEKLVHRDIKPENILLSGGHAKVADFGLARALHSQRMSSSNAAGTLLYMAPEVWGKKVGPANDQYSLALTYAELLMGYHPFDKQAKAGGVYGVMLAHLNEEPDLSDLPATEQPVVLRALAKDPAHRFPDCMSFIQALGQISVPRHIPAPPKREGLGLGFDLLRPLGNAQRGITFKALAPDGKLALVNRIVLREDYRLNRNELETFAQLLRLEHPNLLPLQACWVGDRDNQLLWAVNRQGVVVSKELPATLSGGTINLAADLLVETLARRLEQASQERPGLPPGTALEYLKQAAAVLDFLNAPHPVNRKNVYFRHCAVSPESLLVDAQGIHLGDLSLVQMVEGPEAALPSYLGGFSPTYSAPELFDNRVTDTSDQYSLAILYYYLRTGQLPFEADSSAQRRIDLHREGKLDFRFLPPPEQKVLARGAKRDPGARFPTCMALIEALGDAQLQGGPGGMRSRPAEPSPRKSAAAPAAQQEVHRTHDVVNNLTLDPNTTWDVNVQPPSPLEMTIGGLNAASLPELEVESPGATAAPAKEVSKTVKTTKKAPRVDVGAKLPDETTPEMRATGTVKDATKQARQTMKVPPEFAPIPNKSWRQGAKDRQSPAGTRTSSRALVLIAAAVGGIVVLGVGAFLVFNRPSNPEDTGLIARASEPSNATGSGTSHMPATKVPTTQGQPTNRATGGNATPPSTIPTPPPSVDTARKTPDPREELLALLERGDGYLRNQEWDNARANYELARSKSANSDAMKKNHCDALLGLARTAAGKDTDWNEVRSLVPEIQKCETHPEYVDYLNLLLKLHPGGAFASTSELSSAVKDLVKFRTSTIPGNLRETWEQERVKKDGDAIVGRAAAALKTAPIGEGLDLLDPLSKYSAECTPIPNWNGDEWKKELSALQRAEKAKLDSAEKTRRDALQDLGEVLKKRAFLRPADELVHAYTDVALLSSATDNCRAAIQTLEGAFTKGRLEKQDQVKADYYRLLTQMVSSIYPKAERSADFIQLRDYCDRFGTDAKGLILACKAEALLVADKKVEEARKTAWSKDAEEAGAYGEFVRGRILKEDGKAEQAVTLFGQAIDPTLAPQKLPAWQSRSRCELAAETYYQFAKGSQAPPAELFPRYERAIALVMLNKGTVPPLYRLAVAETAEKLQPPKSARAKLESAELLKNTEFLNEDPTRTYAVRLLHARAQTELREFDGASRDYDELLKPYRQPVPKDLPGVKDAAEAYAQLILPAIETSTAWQKSHDDEASRHQLARFYADKGHFLYLNYEEKGLLNLEPKPLARALAAYKEAANWHEKDDPLRAEYLTWQGYLLTQQGGKVDDTVIAEMKDLAKRAETADKRSSGAQFIMGLALHYQADNHLKQGRIDQVDETEAQAVNKLTKAIEDGKESPLLDLYYETSSAAHLMLGNRLYDSNARNESAYRPELTKARDHALASLKHDPHYPWHAHFLCGLALEDLALYCTNPKPEKLQLFSKAIEEFGYANRFHPGDASVLVGRGRAYLRRARTVLPLDKDLLAKAQTDFEAGLGSAEKKHDTFYTSEARVWLTEIHLELGNYDKAIATIKPALRTVSDAWWPEVMHILQWEINLGWTGDAKAAQVLFPGVLEQCKEVKLRADDLTQKGRAQEGTRCLLESQLFTAQAYERLADRNADAAPEKASKDWSAAKEICDKVVAQQKDMEEADPARYVEVLLLRSRVLLASPDFKKEDLKQDKPQCIEDCTTAIALINKHKLDASLRLKAFAQRGPARYYKVGSLDQPQLKVGEIELILKDYERAIQLDEEAVEADKGRKPDKNCWSWHMDAGDCRLALWSKADRTDAAMLAKALEHFKKALKDPNTPRGTKTEANDKIKFLEP